MTTTLSLGPFQPPIALLSAWLVFVPIFRQSTFTNCLETSFCATSALSGIVCADHCRAKMKRVQKKDKPAEKLDVAKSPPVPESPFFCPWCCTNTSRWCGCLPADDTFRRLVPCSFLHHSCCPFPLSPSWLALFLPLNPFLVIDFADVHGIDLALPHDPNNDPWKCSSSSFSGPRAQVARLSRVGSPTGPV